jgi:uncharacterized protein with HEPN domain
MFDKELVYEILTQLSASIETIQLRFAPIKTTEDFTETPDGKEKLDSICMQLIALGESLKNLDKITNGKLLSRFPEIDWRGAKGMRDIICHHYFDIDADAIFLVCQEKLEPISKVIKEITKELL